MGQKTIRQCDEILTSKGSILEMEEIKLEGRQIRVWKNTFRSFLIGRLGMYKDRTFISSPTFSGGREELTFDQVLTRALRVAAWLVSRGLGKGSKVAVGGMNCTGWIVSFIAAHLIGAIAIFPNVWLQPNQLTHCLRIAKPDIMFVDKERKDILETISELRGMEIICWDDPSPWDHVSEQEIQRVKNGDGIDIGPEDDAVVFFSSGTSGPPKAIISTQRMALTNLWSGLVAPARAALRLNAPISPLPTPADPQKVVLISIPLFHVTGCLSLLMRAFFAGSKMVLMSKWDVKEAVRLIIAHKVSVVGGVPAIATALLHSKDLPRDYNFESVFYGGAPPSKELAKEIKTRWPLAGLVQGYGLTETNAYVCSVAGQDYVERPDSTGVPVPVADVKIVDAETRKQVPTGQIGLLLVRGPQVMKGYLDDPVATRKAIDKDGYFDTGDLACLDEEGFVYIKDRLKDIIIRGGENIVSADVENALYAHPAVYEAVAIGVPDSLLGEKVGTIVSLRSGTKVSEQDLIDFVKRLLPRFAIPVIVHLVHEPLPRNVNGKIVKKDLKPILVAEWEKRGRIETGKIKAKL